jgi:light-regulated signal transduction histidine kinase (bacteriophytochrome)
MTDTPPDVEACEREPIHIPGSIQRTPPVRAALRRRGEIGMLCS